MEDKIQNLHDRFFKSIMEDREIAIAFLEEFLPENVKELLVLEKLTHAPTTFISPDLGEYLADMVFNVPLRSESTERESCYVSILLEHKSYVDHHIDFQILQYLAQSYRQQIQNRQKLKLVIPFLYYHGETK